MSRRVMTSDAECGDCDGSGRAKGMHICDCVRADVIRAAKPGRHRQILVMLRERPNSTAAEMVRRLPRGPDEGPEYHRTLLASTLTTLRHQGLVQKMGSCEWALTKKGEQAMKLADEQGEGT